MNRPPVRFAFCRLFTVALLLPLAPWSGCQPAPDEPGQFTAYEPPELPACASSSWCYKVGDFRPASAVDYLELRFAGDGVTPGPCVADSVGTKCAKSTDAKSCRTELVEITPAWTYVRSGSYSLCTTTDNRVQTISLRKDSLAPFLIPIDSAQEAAFLASGAGYDVDCAAPMDQVVRAVPGGYEVIGSTGHACGPGDDVYRHTLRVGTDGSITDEKSELTMKTDLRCVVE